LEPKEQAVISIPEVGATRMPLTSSAIAMLERETLTVATTTSVNSTEPRPLGACSARMRAA